MAAAKTIPPIAAHRREQLLASLSQIALMPSTLAVPMKLLELQRDKTTTMDKFAAAVSCDPSLVAKILGLVNSAAFKPAKPITKVSQALVMIGLKNLLPLVFGASLGGIHNQFSMPSDERSAFWKASLLKAVAARECALLIAPECAEEAMIAGLMQDLSLPLLYGVDRSTWAETQAILEINERSTREDRETRLFGIDHAQLTAALAAKLGLPESLQIAFANHHHGAETLATALGNKGLAQSVALSAGLPHRITATNAALKNDLASSLKAPGIGISSTIAPVDLWRRISASYATTFNQLGDPDERGGAFKPFMQALCAEVAICLESAIGHSTQVISGLKDREAELEKGMADLKQQVVQSEFDLLTQVLNRKGFLKRAQRLASLVEGQGATCIIGFVDLDDFKHINDTRGHDVGDLALVSLAKRLIGLIRKQGIVGRLGGDEFAFVAFVTEQGGIDSLVKTIREQMCKFELVLEDGPLAISCSIGVTNLNVGALVSPLEESLRRADELMYGAKRAGKGQCMVAATAPTQPSPPAPATNAA